MSVRVAIDFNCAASWLAVEPTRALESRLGTAFEWLPFPSAAKPPAPAVASTQPRVEQTHTERSARHSMLRSQYLADEIRRYAAARGLEVGEIYRSKDTTLASLGLLWMGRQDPTDAGEYVSRIFDLLWREDAEANRDLVEAALGKAAPGFAQYAAGAGEVELAATREGLAEEGLWNVPGYLTGGEVFIGRQHLPIVEWFATSEEAAAASIRRRG